MSEKFLTKEKLIGGVEHTETVETVIGKFKIRSLTINEKGIADTMILKGMKVTGTLNNLQMSPVSGDGQDLAKNMFENQCYVCACGLSIKGGDQWTPEEIKALNISPSIIEQIAKDISLLTGGNEVEMQVDSFRKDAGGSATGEDSGGRVNDVGSDGGTVNPDPV